MKVFKYILPDPLPYNQSSHTLELPEGAKFLKLAYQNGQITTWWLCDPEAPLRPKLFAVIGTGADIKTPVHIMSMDYLDSAVSDSLVWHVFTT